MQQLSTEPVISPFSRVTTSHCHLHTAPTQSGRCDATHEKTDSFAFIRTTHKADLDGILGLGPRKLQGKHLRLKMEVQYNVVLTEIVNKHISNPQH